MSAPRTDFHTLASLEALKRELLLRDTGRDEEIVAMADMLASDFEEAVERPLIYRGTLVAAGDLGVVAWVDGLIAVSEAALPGPRSLHVEWTSGNPSGTLLVTGTLNGVAVTESFVAGEQPLRGTKLFDALTGATATGAGGQGNVSVGSVLPYTELHSLRSGLPASHLYLRARPALTIAEVNEDVARTFGTSTRMVVNTDYVLERGVAKLTKVRGLGGVLGVDFPEDYIQRFPQKLPSYTTATRAIRVIYSGGFKFDLHRSHVPGDLRNGFLQAFAIRWREAERKMQGVSSLSDAAGGTTRFTKGDIPEHVMKMLETYKTFSWSGEFEVDE